MEWLFALAGVLVGMVLYHLIRYAPLQQTTVKLEAERNLAEERARQTTQALAQLSEEKHQLAQERDELLGYKAKYEVAQNNDKLVEAVCNKVLKEQAEQLSKASEGERKREVELIKEIVEPLKLRLESYSKEQFQLKQEIDHFVSLSRVLSNSKGRGDWGELELERILEESGVRFERQNTVDGKRPDVVVPLTNNRKLIIDAKTVMEHLRQASTIEDPEQQQVAFEQHVRALEREIHNLAGKDYPKLFKESIDFVVFFVPRESLLRIALEQKPQLMEEAFRKNIILASPLILMAILKAVAYEWQQIRLSKETEELKDIAVKLYESSATFMDHYSAIGKHLNQAGAKYNEARNSFTSRLIPRIKKMSDLSGNAITGGKIIKDEEEVPEFEPVIELLPS